MLKINKFTVENIEQECVTDNSRPRFSFSVISDRSNVILKHAIISLGDWSIKTSSQVAIEYGGPTLQPFTKYTAFIKATDDVGEIAEASVTFETGRLDVPWKAKWITDGSYYFREAKTSPKPMTFQKKISCKKEIESAKIYSTALGIYEIMLNKEKVGKDYFAPGFTSYRNQLQYQTYDISHQLQKNNDLTIVVGGGWAVGAFTHKRRNRVFAKRQALLCEIHILYKDGTEEIIATDDSWQVTMEGNYKETEFYNGEVYDATVDLKASTWKKASVEKVKIQPKILAQYGASVRAQEVLKPISSFRAKSGMMIYDFGQNFAGVVLANLKGKKNQKVVFQHAEILMNGELYRKPLRTAGQEAIYTCVEGEQSYSPRMTYMGFRYVGVAGIDEKDLELRARALYSEIEQNGEFSCSNEMLNKLQSNIVWSTKSNFVDIPTDCPQRD